MGVRYKILLGYVVAFWVLRKPGSRALLFLSGRGGGALQFLIRYKKSVATAMVLYVLGKVVSRYLKRRHQLKLRPKACDLRRESMDGHELDLPGMVGDGVLRLEAMAPSEPDIESVCEGDENGSVKSMSESLASIKTFHASGVPLPFLDRSFKDMDSEDQHRRFSFLASTKLIGLLGEEAFFGMLEEANWVTLSAGQTLFHRGDTCEDGMYIVLNGRIAMHGESLDDADGDQTSEPMFGMVGKGEILGELAVLLSDSHRSTTCRAVSDSYLAQISRPLFNRWIRRYPFAAVSFVRRITARQWRISEFVLDDFLQLDVLSHSLQVPVISDRQVLEEAASKFPTVSLQKGHTISLTYGTQRMVIVITGKVRVLGADSESPPQNSPGAERTRRGSVAGAAPGEVGPGGIIGGLMLFTGIMKKEVVLAMEDTQLVVLTNESFDSRYEDTPGELVVEIALTMVQSLRHVIHEFMELGMMTLCLQPESAGKVLYRQGDPSDCLYIVISGRVRLFQKSSNSTSREPVAEISHGESLGEEALLEHTRDCEAVCVRDTEVVRISRTSFELICKKHPRAIFRFNLMLARRLKQLVEAKSSRNVERVSTIVIAPCSGISNENIEGFATRLKKQLAHIGITTVLHSRAIDEKLGEGVSSLLHQDFYQVKLSYLLSEIEESSQFIIFVPDNTMSSWTRFCFRQADIVLYVGDFANEPSMYPVSQRIQSTSRKRYNRHELVLLHNTGGNLRYRPSGTGRWLDEFEKNGVSLRQHHHIRTHRRDDFDRLARYIAGKAVGVVLGGGGAKGLAHEGVLMAMQEKGVPIDFVGGVSQGAFMGALYCMHMDTKLVHQDCAAFSKNFRSVQMALGDLTLPILSLFSGRTFNKLVKNAFGNLCIEDLWIPFFSLTTNITTGSCVVHKRGPVWKYVRASMSLIGYVPPILDNRRDLLVDGGYANNLPVDIMRQTYMVNKVIAVDVEDKDTSQFVNISNYGDHISGWWLLMQRMNPFASNVKIPSHADIQGALTYLSHTRQLSSFFENGEIDLYIRPPVAGYALLDYHRHKELIDLGYQYALKKLTQWKAESNARQNGKGGSNKQMTMTRSRSVEQNMKQLVNLHKRSHSEALSLKNTNAGMKNSKSEINFTSMVNSMEGGMRPHEV